MTGKLYIYQGLPASGKSSACKKQLELNPDWIQVELDILRDEHGISRQDYNDDAERLIRQERNVTILAALKAGKTVISSDTNLNPKTCKTLESLAAQASAEVEYVKFTHVPIEVCIERDKKRSHPVGEAVIYKMYSRIRPNDLVKEEKTLVVSDIHGDWRRLTKLLSRFGIRDTEVWAGQQGYQVKWSNPYGYKVIFLGDICDQRLDDDYKNIHEMDSLECLRIVYELCKLGIAELVQSNHQRNLINFWYGRRKNLGWGLHHTVREIHNFINSGDTEEVKAANKRYISNLINWLEGRPYFYSFYEGGRQFYCVHAFYTPGMSQYHPSSKDLSNSIYGLRKDDERVEWWWDSQYYSDEYIILAGHYHSYGYFPHELDPKAILLDGGCGNTGGSLIGFTPANMQMHLI